MKRSCLYYGGNKVQKVDLEIDNLTLFASEPYVFFTREVNSKNPVRIEELNSSTVFILEKSLGSRLTLSGKNINLERGDVIQSENEAPVLAINDGFAKIIVAGTPQSQYSIQKMDVTKYENIYKVEKPWGYELWINGEHPGFALKNIFIKHGTKTSLQYHNMKQETNVLFQGKAKLHFNNGSLSNLILSSVDLEAATVIDVAPKVVHRLEAVTDILLFEVSTPFLDDVVRIQDDTHRENGRVSSEHSR